MKKIPSLALTLSLLLASFVSSQAQNRNTVPLFTVALGSETSEVCASGDYAYVARGTVGIDVVKISGAGAPAKLGTIRPYAGQANVDIGDVQVVGNTLYASNHVPNGSVTPHTGLFMYNLATNAVNPPLVGTITWGEFAGSYMGASVHNFCVDVAAGRSYAYLASVITNTVVVFDVTNPAAPEFKDSFRPLPNGSGFTVGAIHDVAVKNGKCAATFGTGGFSVFDVSNIALSHIDYDLEEFISYVTVLNTTIYPNAVCYHAAFSEDGNTLITVDGRYYIGCRTWNLATITAPNVALVHSGQFTSGTTAFMHNVHVQGKYIYLSNFMDGLRIVELEPGGTMSEIARYDTTPTGTGGGSSGVWGVFVAGEKVLLGDTLLGLVAVDFRDTLTVPKAEWKNSTNTLTIEGTSTAAPSVDLSVGGFGSMTWNSFTGKYVLVRTGVNNNPGTITISSSIGGTQTAQVRRR